MKVRIIVRHERFDFQMTRNFTLLAQAVAVVAQFMVDPAARLWHWSPELVEFIHAGVASLQGLQAVLAHKYNNDGTLTK